MQEEEYTMYIIVNESLNMSKGKIASQVGHVTECIAERLIKGMHETSKPQKKFIDYIKYSKSGRKKIVLKAPQDDIIALSKEDDAEYIIDAGRTEIEPGSMTVVAFFPSNTNKERFKKYKLL
jgi:peptidyl-tRNA hydrolase